MAALIAAVFLASLLGSLHCVGMCGVFVGIAAGGAQGGRGMLQVAYHGGRLVTYTLLGAAAGAAGQLVDLGGALAGLQPIAAVLAGAFMIAFGLVSLLRLGGWNIGALRPPAFLARFLQRGHRAAAGYSPLTRALAIGLLTTLLPCGWLYAFVATAAGTASPATGALIMAVFWSGSVPALAAVGGGVRMLLGSVGKHLSAVMAIGLVCLGLLSLRGRFLMDPAALAGRVRPAATDSGAIQPQAPPCCSTHDDSK